MTTPPAAAPLSAPHVAVSLHAWDACYNRPGASETMTAEFAAQLDALAALNTAVPNTVTRVRVDMGWSASQPTPAAPDPGYYYNRRFTRLFTELAARGLRPFVVVHQSPPWARPDGASAKHLPAAPELIRPWAAWFAAHYAPWVSEVEFWNEPNLEAFAGPGWAVPARYVPVLASFAAAARAANPALRVIGGNVSQCDWAWLRGAYDLGMGGHCDVVGVHPYQGNQAVPPASTDSSGLNKHKAGWEKGRITAGLPRVGALMAAYGDSGKPIWATEVGWSASTSGVGLSGVGHGLTWPTLPDKAAAYQNQLLAMFATGRDDDGPQPVYRQVRCVTVYEAFDPQSTDPHQKGFEVLERSGAPRAQARALGVFRRRFPQLRALY